MLKAPGFTLMELLVTTIVAMVVAVGITTVDVGRVRMHNELMTRSQQDTEEQQVGLAALLLAKDIQLADRVNILNTGVPGNMPYAPPPGDGDIQIRIPVGCMAVAPPPPTCFDVAANYEWVQYHRVGNELRRYGNTGGGCGAVRVVAREIGATPQNQGLEIIYKDAANDPPWPVGGPDDTNVFKYNV